MLKKASGVVFFIFILLTGFVHAQFSVLHSFAGAPADGSTPYGSLVIGGSTIYGMTRWGGAHGDGCVYKSGVDGTGFALLHSFDRNDMLGCYPLGRPVLKGKTLYGMTNYGDPNVLGTIFKINADGSGFDVLHSFVGGGLDGAGPCGDLVFHGGFLYGMTESGGISDLGVIFKIKKDGSGFAVLHSFSGSAADGERPIGSLAFKGSKLYGMTVAGGSADRGVIFRMNADGTGFVVLHSFTMGGNDGADPEGSVIIKGSILYGLTKRGGGANLRGCLFKMNVNGSEFSVLHSFAGAPADGVNPMGSLIMKGNVLYGMTPYGGSSGTGTLFRMNLKDSSFAILHSFAGGAADGANPFDSLILKNGILYGMTSTGGISGLGTIFSYSTK